MHWKVFMQQKSGTGRDGWGHYISVKHIMAAAVFGSLGQYIFGGTFFFVV